MGRAPCCDKANVKKGPWSPEEDARLKSYIDQHGTGGNWIALPQKIGLKRCGKSCRLRWLNYLRPNIKHGGFSDEEDNIICSLYISIGSRWSIIAAQLPGRTDNDIKNYWNTRLKKKLLGKQRKDKSSTTTTRAKLQTPKPNQDSGGGLNYQSAAALQLPLPQLQPIPYSDEEPRLNNHASIRRLLMKLGGRFSSQDQTLESGSAIDDQALLPPFYGTSPNIDQLGGSSDQIPLVNEVHFDYSVELERVVYENQQRLQGFEELLYDDDAMMNRVSWGEMNPWSFAPNSASSSSDMQGFVPDPEYSLEEMRYQGTL